MRTRRGTLYTLPTTQPKPWKSLTEVDALARLAADSQAGQTVAREGEDDRHGHEHPRHCLGGAEGEADPPRFAYLLMPTTKSEETKKN